MLVPAVVATAPKVALVMLLVLIYKLVEKYVIEKILEIFQRVKAALEFVVVKVKDGFIEAYNKTLGQVFGAISKQQISVFCRECARHKDDAAFDLCLEQCVNQNELLPLKPLDFSDPDFGVEPAKPRLTRTRLTL